MFNATSCALTVWVRPEHCFAEPGFEPRIQQVPLFEQLGQIPL